MTSKRSTQKPITAKDLLSRLRQDPAYLQRMADKEAKRLQAVEVNKRDSSPILADLAQAGCKVDWISDLYNKGLKYERAIPILLAWLPQIENKDVKEDVVRALSVPWAGSSASPILIQEFRRASDDTNVGLKWTIANALSVVADDSVFNELSELVQDKQHGKAREMLAVALGNMRDPRAVGVLVRLLNDDEVAGHAIMALGKLRATKARQRIERFLDHPKAWIRKEAKRALDKIDKA